MEDSKVPAADEKSSSETGHSLDGENAAAAAGPVVVQEEQQIVPSETMIMSSSLLESTRKDSFEEYIIRPSSPDNVNYQEDVENILNQDGSKTKRIKILKEITGECPKINAKEAFGRQERELSEVRSSTGVLSYTDIKRETIIGEDGTKLVRTSQVARVRYPRTHYRNSSVSSLFIDTSNRGYNDSIYSSKLGGSRDDQALSYWSRRGNSLTRYDQIRDRMMASSENTRRSPSYTTSAYYHIGRTSGNYHYAQQSPNSCIHDRGNRFYLYISPRASAHAHQTSTAASSSSANTSASHNIRASSYTPYSYSTTSRYSMPNTTSLRYSLSPQRTYQRTHTLSPPPIREIVPPTFSYELENVTVSQGGTACFQGTVNGTYPFETRWYLNNKELSSSADSRLEMSIRQDYSETFLTGLIDYIISLRIFNCSYNDIGKYTVFVRNEAGDASCSSFLVIEGILST